MGTDNNTLQDIYNQPFFDIGLISVGGWALIVFMTLIVFGVLSGLAYGTKGTPTKTGWFVISSISLVFGLSGVYAEGGYHDSRKAEDLNIVVPTQVYNDYNVYNAKPNFQDGEAGKWVKKAFSDTEHATVTIMTDPGAFFVYGVQPVDNTFELYEMDSTTGTTPTPDELQEPVSPDTAAFQKLCQESEECLKMHH